MSRLMDGGPATLQGFFTGLWLAAQTATPPGGRRGSVQAAPLAPEGCSGQARAGLGL